MVRAEPTAAIDALDLTAGTPPMLPTEIADALRDPSSAPYSLQERFFTLRHRVRIDVDRTLSVIETFTLKSWQWSPRRAVLMLPGPVTNAAFYNIEAAGYHGGEIMARQGFFAFAVDLEGSGESSCPADGRAATLERQRQNLEHVIRYIRAIREVPRIDLLGESWGGAIAIELSADSTRVRSCVASSMLYVSPSEIAFQTFLSPQFRGFLDTIADGYMPTAPESYAPFLANSPPAVKAFASATQPGRYSTAPEYGVLARPYFDPRRARVPGLIINGQNDPNHLPADSERLAADYGGGAELLVIEGAGHVPRIEAEPVNAAFWSAVTRFFDEQSGAEQS